MGEEEEALGFGFDEGGAGVGEGSAAEFEDVGVDGGGEVGGGAGFELEHAFEVGVELGWGVAGEGGATGGE